MSTGARGVDVDEWCVEIERRRLDRRPLRDRLRRLMLGKVTRMPVGRVDALHVALDGEIHRAAAVDLEQRLSKCLEVGFRNTTPEVGLEDCRLCVSRERVHHAVRGASELLRPLEITGPERAEQVLP